MHHRSARVLLALSIAIGGSQETEAAGPVQIAFSDKLGAEVFANPDSSGQWCRESVSLSLLLRDNSPLLGSGLSEFITRIGGTLTAKCATAKRARVAVYRDSDRKLVAGPYTISGDSHWVSPQDMGKAGDLAKPSPMPADHMAENASAPSASRENADQPPLINTEMPPPTEAPIQAPAAQVAPQTQAVYVPSELSPFNSLLVAKVAENPALLHDDTVLRYWARSRFPGEFGPVENQEFKVRPVLDKAQSDLKDLAARSVPGKVTLLVNAQLGAYDFQRSSFPINGLGNMVNYGRTVWNPMSVLGNAALFLLPELPALATLPMDPKDAEAYLARHTRWGAIDRSVTFAVDVSYQPGTEALVGGVTKVNGHIATAWLLDGNKPFYTYNAAQLAQLQHDLEAKQEAERKQREEQQRTDRLAALSRQRDQNMSFLSRLPPDVRLANFISGAPDVEPYVRLDSLAIVRGRALISERPIAARMLVQAGSSGGDHVDTRWPGHLRLTVPEGAPSLVRGAWYLVDGTLSLDGPADELKPAELSAKTLFACKQDFCADAQDPGAIIDHKLAVIGGL